METRYDGGRLSISINNKESFNTSLAGNDFCIDIEQRKKK